MPMDITEIARYELIKNIAIMSEVKVYVELGTRRFNQINKIVPYVERAIGIDILLNDSWKENMDERVEFYQMATDKYIEGLGLKIPWIDMLFIDADHSYVQSYEDFINYHPHVKPNGLILLHDSYPPDQAYINPSYCGEVYKTAWRIRTEWSKEFEICTIPGSFGVSVIRKADKQLMWRE
jgi:hypothetical protein